jgi:hypothetical protein
MRISGCGRKPLLSVGLSYNKGGGATATGSGYRADSRREKQRKLYEGIPWLKVMTTIMVIIIFVILFLVISEYPLLEI